MLDRKLKINAMALIGMNGFCKRYTYMVVAWTVFIRFGMGQWEEGCRDWVCDSLAVQALIDSNGRVDIDVPSLVYRNPKGRVDSLDIQYKSFTRITASIGAISELEFIRGFNNQISYIAPEIGRLKKLEALLLSKNRLESLPEAIGACSSLRVLWVNTNRLKAIPGTIGNLKNLREASFSSNALQHLPAAIAGLDSLKHLDVGLNAITGFPGGILRLQSLQYLDVVHNRLCSLPVSLENWLDNFATDPRWRDSQACGSGLKSAIGWPALSVGAGFNIHSRGIQILQNARQPIDGKIFRLNGARVVSFKELESE